MFTLFFVIALYSTKPADVVKLGVFNTKNECVAAGDRMRLAIQSNTYKYNHYMLQYSCIERKK